jgi:hypothetical protein
VWLTQPVSKGDRYEGAKEITLTFAFRKSLENVFSLQKVDELSYYQRQQSQKLRKLSLIQLSV